MEDLETAVLDFRGVPDILMREQTEGKVGFDTSVGWVQSCGRAKFLDDALEGESPTELSERESTQNGVCRLSPEIRAFTNSIKSAESSLEDYQKHYKQIITLVTLDTRLYLQVGRTRAVVLSWIYHGAFV